MFAKDADDWMPERNHCWFARQVVKVKRKYGLTVDQREMRALENVLISCKKEAPPAGAGSPNGKAPRGYAPWPPLKIRTPDSRKRVPVLKKGAEGP